DPCRRRRESAVRGQASAELAAGHAGGRDAQPPERKLDGPAVRGEGAGGRDRVAEGLVPLVQVEVVQGQSLDAARRRRAKRRLERVHALQKSPPASEAAQEPAEVARAAHAASRRATASGARRSETASTHVARDASAAATTAFASAAGLLSAATTPVSPARTRP